jgi:aspartyl-tRNA(Asn)/glutamyl-tRNA(Gln) amidotransferase subunit B
VLNASLALEQRAQFRQSRVSGGKMSSYRIQGATGEWEVVIGLEVHAQVTTNAKLFSVPPRLSGPSPTPRSA